MGKITRRLLEIRLPPRRSAFLWGPRRRRSLVVCLERQPRQLTKTIEAVPWNDFVDRLWSGVLV